MQIMSDPHRKDWGVAPEVVRMLGEMLEVAMILRRRRLARGALELNLPEIAVELGERGEVTGAHLTGHDQSHQVIEEFMVAANEAVAAHLTEHHAFFLRRVHPDPDPLKLERFAEFARSLEFAIELPQSRFELQRVLRESAGKPEEYAVHFGLLKSMKQAAYAPEREGHYALASDDYCHFTSPIRRYPDLQVHRQLLNLLEGKKPRGQLDELMALGEHCTRTERRAETAERELIRVKLLAHLETKIGEAMHAIVTSVEDFGIFCRLVELPIEGLIHVTSLADDFYYLEPATHTLIGRSSGRRHRLGDRILVRIAHIDVDRRELDLVPADAPRGHDRRSRLAGRKQRAAPEPDSKAHRPDFGAKSGSKDPIASALPSGTGKPRKRKSNRKTNPSQTRRKRKR
jgi:ribonuclease R